MVFRVAALAVCLYLILRWQHLYRHPGQALAVGAAMVLVTGLVSYLGWTGRAHRLPVVVADLVASVLLTLATRNVQTLGQRHGSMPTLTTIWATGPVVEAAIVTGLVGGIGAALVQIAAAMAVRDGWDGRTLDSAVLLLVAGSVVGYLGRLIVLAEEQTRAMAAVQAATAERQRLARSVHDGALQVLALVHRDGLAAGGRWATLGAAAAEQEAALRRLIAAEETRAPQDLAGELTALRTDTVSVVLIGEPILPDPVADALLGAVGEALRNVAGMPARRRAPGWSTSSPIRPSGSPCGTTAPGWPRDGWPRRSRTAGSAWPVRSAGRWSRSAVACGSRRSRVRAPRSCWRFRCRDQGDGGGRSPDLAGRAGAGSGAGRSPGGGRVRRR